MKKKKTLITIGEMILTVVGFITIPSLLKWFSDKLYKYKSNSTDIDSDNMGPEIVRKTKDSEKENEE